ncbi:MAG: PAS domain-containing protein, partial [Patescibacteria group bacterium]
MMKSIKTKIISAFLAVIGVMIILLSLVIIIDLNLIKRYERINENIIYEQTLKDGVQLLVESGYSGIKSSDYSKYYERLDEILEIEKILDLRFADADADQEAALAYRSAKNSLAAVISIVEESRENWENTGELTGTSETYQDAIIKFEFVKQSVTELLLSEIKNIAKTTEEIKRIKAFFFIIFGALVLLITVFLVIFAWLFTKKISDAIVDLSETAEYIIGGDLKIDVNESLLERQDEIGSLSRSFSVMVKNLRDKFSALELSKKKMDDKVKEVSASNAELEKTKTAMVNLLDDANILENSLRRERDRIKTIISSMGEGLIVVNEKNKIILANPIAEKFLEISAKKLLGQDLNKVVPLYSGEEKVDPDKHPIRQALATSQIVVSSLEDNFFLHAASGRKFSTLIVAAPVLGEDLSGAVMMFRDASEEKALDEAKIG